MIPFRTHATKLLSWVYLFLLVFPVFFETRSLLCLCQSNFPCVSLVPPPAAADCSPVFLKLLCHSLPLSCLVVTVSPRSRALPLSILAFLSLSTYLAPIKTPSSLSCVFDPVLCTWYVPYSCDSDLAFTHWRRVLPAPVFDSCGWLWTVLTTPLPNPWIKKSFFITSAPGFLRSPTVIAVNAC